MKTDIKALIKEVEKKAGKHLTIASDFEKLTNAVCNGGEKLAPQALKRVWGGLNGSEKPSRKTLDMLALISGLGKLSESPARG